MYRFYCQDADFSKSSVVISDIHEIHHIKDVLRLKKGSLIQIFNAKSEEAQVVIEQINKEAIGVSVKTVKQNEEARAKIILACAPPKKGKFEFIIEKCTELGVDEIIPLKTKRTEVIFKEDRMLAKLSRFEAVAVNAAKQSQRPKVPRIYPMMTILEVFKMLDPKTLMIIPSLNGQLPHIVEVLNKYVSFPNASVGNLVSGPPIKTFGGDSIVIFIGPEGDFTPDEVELAIKHGCIPVSLGDTVLKVETAAIAAVALVKFLCRN
jgi:16S rRNA (uracil1498-N3)-methyltransferase